MKFTIEWRALYSGESEVDADTKEEAKELLAEEHVGSGWAFESDNSPEVEMDAFEVPS